VSELRAATVFSGGIFDVEVCPYRGPKGFLRRFEPEHTVKREVRRRRM
jgi:hypothetical protein